MDPIDTQERPLEEIEEEVDALLEEHEVVLFMKGNELLPQCGYSRKALGLLSQYRDDVVCVDVLAHLPQYRQALKRHSQRETIPQAFVGGTFIGGSDILEQLDERGELAATVNG